MVGLRRVMWSGAIAEPDPFIFSNLVVKTTPLNSGLYRLGY
jgi:hypothetical protein